MEYRHWLTGIQHQIQSGSPESAAGAIDGIGFNRWDGNRLTDDDISRGSPSRRDGLSRAAANHRNESNPSEHWEAGEGEDVADASSGGPNQRNGFGVRRQRSQCAEPRPASTMAPASVIDQPRRWRRGVRQPNNSIRMRIGRLQRESMSLKRRNNSSNNNDHISVMEWIELKRRGSESRRWNKRSGGTDEARMRHGWGTADGCIH